jgi:predicted regulator of Ras-like GTPase activity (Roadblock/LC7/MglB family)
VSAFSKLQAAICQRSIDQLLKDTAGIMRAVVATTDGFEVVHAPQLAEESGDGGARLAAMSSSMLALAEAMAKEGNLTECNDVLVDCSDGRMLLLSVPAQEARFVLCVAASSSSTLGHVLAAARLCAQEMSRKLK